MHAHFASVGTVIMAQLRPESSEDSDAQLFLEDGGLLSNLAYAVPV